MCGRATLSAPIDELRDIFGLDELPELPPRFNIAPTQPIAVIREPRRLELLRRVSSFRARRNAALRGSTYASSPSGGLRPIGIRFASVVAS
jgi:putative SOS response-associated peptidase YedK